MSSEFEEEFKPGLLKVVYIINKILAELFKRVHLFVFINPFVKGEHTLEDQQLYGYFKRQTKTCLRKGNLKIETELFQRHENNRIIASADYVVTEMKINKYSKLVQKPCKSRHEWVGKVIQWELYKTLKFDPSDEWYMLKPKSVQENETHKILRDFKIHMDHSISARRPDLILINKKKRTCHKVDFAVSVKIK